MIPREGSRTPETIDMGEAIRYPVAEDGWLNLRTEPWCEVYFRGELIGTTPLNHLVFPAGKHPLRLVNKAAGVERRIEIEIRPGHESTTRLRLTSE